ncbi:MAG TPA: serine hydrolase domain-containing protein [Pseudonocardia sp.]|jgi:CubicO group peptidase (beta-lactamase class C family)|nr:serine hydrolase domain-containing protein [Pseudonocardia sp.]
MSELRTILEKHVGDGSIPGAVALVGRRDSFDVQVVGSLDTEGTAAMTRDAIFRIASITKPIVAAAVMMLVEEGRLALEDPVGRWLPEISDPVVVRTPSSPVHDLVPAARPITVFDLLTFRAGWGFPSDFTLPAVEPLFAFHPDGREVSLPPPPDEWMAALARVPLLYQPGEAWLYNTCSDLQGVLIARVAGQSLPDFLAERLFEPLGMADTGFSVPPEKRGRLTSYYRNDPDGGHDGRGGLTLADGPHGQWSTVPAFPSGAGGLVSTLDDWLAFARMLLAEGRAPGGSRLLTADSVHQMTTDHLTDDQRRIGAMFLQGQGWGFGGSVDIAATAPWNVPGRFGWVGGTGTAGYIVPTTGSISILLTQVALDGPVSPAVLEDFCVYAAGA